MFMNFQNTTTHAFCTQEVLEEKTTTRTKARTCPFHSRVGQRVRFDRLFILLAGPQPVLAGRPIRQAEGIPRFDGRGHAFLWFTLYEGGLRNVHLHLQIKSLGANSPHSVVITFHATALPTAVPMLSFISFFIVTSFTFLRSLFAAAARTETFHSSYFALSCSFRNRSMSVAREEFASGPAQVEERARCEAEVLLFKHVCVSPAIASSLPALLDDKSSRGEGEAPARCPGRGQGLASLGRDRFCAGPEDPSNGRCEEVEEEEWAEDSRDRDRPCSGGAGSRLERRR